jgi:cell wall-associated NlpC family hydrolase
MKIYLLLPLLLAGCASFSDDPSAPTSSPAQSSKKPKSPKKPPKPAVAKKPIPPPALPSGQARTDERTEVVLAALAQVGRPYVLGGNEPDTGFDCSGLTRYAFQKAGAALPRRAYDQCQGAGAEVIPLENVEAGDLICASIPLTGEPDHVLLYVGDGQAIHAPRVGKNVGTVLLNNPYWQPRLRYGVRWLR